MTLVRWDPFRDLMNAQRNLSASFDDESTYGSWAPSVDILERGDDLLIRAELAGVDKNDIDVRVENNQLILTGERREESETKEDSFFRRERRYGKFTRTFSLPRTVDAGSISATYKDGVLELTLPKSERAKPRKIEIAH